MDEALNGFICTLCMTLTSVLEEEFTLVASFLQGHYLQRPFPLSQGVRSRELDSMLKIS